MPKYLSVSGQNGDSNIIQYPERSRATNPLSGGQTTSAADENGAVQDYFQSYADFIYNPAERAAVQFSRLVIEKGWTIGSHEFITALTALNDALLRQFIPSTEGSVEPGPKIGDNFKTAKKKEKKRQEEERKQEQAKAGQENTSPRTVSGPSVNLATLASQAQVEGGASATPSPGERARVGSSTEAKAKTHNKPSTPPTVVNVVGNRNKTRQEMSSEGKGKRDRAKERKKAEKRERKREKKEKKKAEEAGKQKEDEEKRKQAQGKPTGSSSTDSTVISPPAMASGEVRPAPNFPEQDYLETFFRQYYPGFNSIRDRGESLATQMGQLRELEGWWGSRKDLWGIALGRYQDALVLQFNAWYGTDVDDLETWHRVLRIIGVDELPETVSECKRLVDSLHVNLVDLVDASLHPPASRKKIEIFNSVEALSEYTVGYHKFFPKENAKAGGVLKYLLREIMDNLNWKPASVLDHSNV